MISFSCWARTRLAGDRNSVVQVRPAAKCHCQMPNAEFEVTVKVNITPRILQLPLLPVSAPITAVPFNSVHLIHLSLSQRRSLMYASAGRFTFCIRCNRNCNRLYCRIPSNFISVQVNIRLPTRHVTVNSACHLRQVAHRFILTLSRSSSPVNVVGFTAFSTFTKFTVTGGGR